MNEEWKIYKTTRCNRFGIRIYEVSNLGNVKLNGKLIYKIFLVFVISYLFLVMFICCFLF